MEWDNDMLGGLLTGNIFSLVLFAVILCFMITNKKRAKAVAQWMGDATETNAFVKRMDIVSPQFKPYQVQLEFEINGNKYQRISTPGNIIRGYHKEFIKYANKRIRILYSPMYDQVLILKD